MRTRFLLPGGILLLLALLLLVGLVPGLTLAAPLPDDKAKLPAPVAPKGGPGDTICANCHDVAKSFRGNPHERAFAARGGAPEAVCESCHGDSSKHVESGGDKTLIKTLKGLEGSEACLGCHDKSTDRSSFRTGIHANSETVNCQTCHSIHAADPRSAKLLVGNQVDLCGSCHPTVASSFRNEPFKHRIGRGGTECSSCHNPHGLSGRRSLRETAAGQLPCLSCHSEKKGPFVFSHVTDLAGDCLSCHRPHGGPNPHQLIRATEVGLCLECHSRLDTATLGPQPPSFHNLALSRYQNCTTCHVAIHGSNSSPILTK